jgi:hypothetical protein
VKVIRRTTAGRRGGEHAGEADFLIIVQMEIGCPQ